jgi:protein-S-isoprenylcysteine O-methyltransferase Ste14
MAEETIFRIVLAVLVTAMYVPRKYYEQRMRVAARNGLARDEDTRQTLAWQSLLLGITLWAAVLYLVKPVWLAWASLPVAAWLRWSGAVLGALATALLIWTHQALGDNFFGGLKLRQGHELVTWGPYRHVQHPMYVAFVVLGLAYLLLSANGLVGLPWLLGTLLTVAFRLRKEEAMLEGQFGETHAAYRKGTGRFLPRLGARAR